MTHIRHETWSEKNVLRLVHVQVFRCNHPGLYAICVLSIIQTELGMGLKLTHPPPPTPLQNDILSVYSTFIYLSVFYVLKLFGRQNKTTLM